MNHGVGVAYLSCPRVPMTQKQDESTTSGSGEMRESSMDTDGTGRAQLVLQIALVVKVTLLVARAVSQLLRT